MVPLAADDRRGLSEWRSASYPWLKELVGQAALHPGLHECFVIVRYGEVRRPGPVACQASLPMQLLVAQAGNVVHSLVSGDFSVSRRRL